MKLVATKHASISQVEQFLKQNPDVEQEPLLENGYIVEINQKIEGCFILEQVNNKDIYWLKQLHVTKQATPSLPILLESILALAKKQKARSVYVHSHQPVVDIILEALQFHPQAENEFVDKHPADKGSWWAYNVS